MSLFVWDSSFVVGNRVIDAEHQKLVQMVNNFHDAMQEGRGNDVIGKVLNNLVIYTIQHFTHEESEMKRINYPKYLEHKLEHDMLIKNVAELQASFANGKAMLTVKISKFLRDWLVNHIKKSDILLAKALI
jgi:hemerythrin-like metal-binding protein